MVIKKNPKTGKYYIAPSPKSFYKSKEPKPTYQYGTTTPQIIGYSGGGISWVVEPKKRISGGFANSPGKAMASLRQVELKSQAQQRAKQLAEQKRQQALKLAQQRRQAQIQAQRLAEQRRIQQANQARLNQQRSVAQKQFYNIPKYSQTSSFNPYTDSTIRNYGVKKYNLPKIRTRPYLEKKQIDTFRDKDTGRMIPITQLVYINPTGTGKQKERPATEKEKKFFKSQTNNLVIVPLSKSEKIAKKIGVLKEYKGEKGSVIGGYETLNKDIKRSFMEPTLGQIDFEQARKNVEYSTKYLEKSGKYPKFLARGGAVISGAGLGIAEDVRYKPLKYTTIGALSWGAGLVFEGSIAGATALTTARLGAKAGKITLATLRAGEVGTGVYFGGKTAIQTGSRVKQAIKKKNYVGAGDIIGVTGAEIGVGLYGFGRGVKTFRAYDPFTKITEHIKIRDAGGHKAKEISYQIVKKGKEINLGEYILRGEKTPPYLKVKTTKFRKKFGMKPYNDFEIIPAKRYRVQTLEPAVYGEPFLVSEVSQGSRVAKISRISGASERLNIKTARLSKIDLYLLKQQSKVNLISEKNLRKFFKKNDDFSRSVIEKYKLTEINPKKKTLKILPETGRRTELSSAITRTKPLFQTENIEAFTSKTYFKSRNKPFARARGKTPKIETELYRIKKPFILDTEPVNFIQPADIKKTPFSRTFGQQSQQVVKQQMKELTKIIPKSEPIPKPSKVNNIISPQISKYTGLGIYELTSGGLNVGSSKSIIKADLGINDISAITETRLIPKQKIKVKIKQRFRQEYKPQLKSIFKQEYKPQLKQGLKPQLKQKSKQLQKQLQKQKIKIPQLKQYMYSPMTKGDIYRNTKSFVTGGIFNFGKKRKQRTIDIPTYSVQVKRGGKFRPLGSDYVLNKALKIGAKYTRQTLGRTFRIRKTGKTKRVSNINNFGEPNPIIFRNYKIRRGRKISQPFTFIQKTQYSIGTRGEKKAIKEAKRLSRLVEKKRKGKKKKFWRLD